MKNMGSDDVKAIQKLSTQISLVLDQQSAMNKKLDQHTKVLDQHTKVLDQHTKVLDQHTKILYQHTKTFGEIGETLDDNTRRLEALAGDVEQLNMDVKGIRDAEGMFHSRNKREIDEIKDHLGLPIIPDVPQA